MENKDILKQKITLILSMTIFGTIGLVVKYIPLSSSLIALSRGVIGTLFLGTVMIIKREKISLLSLKSGLIRLIFAGIFLGLNWVLLFEAYRYTTVSTATLCYYLAPVFIVIGSALLYKEKISLKKSVCILFALFGMVLVSGIFEEKASSPNNMKGIILGLCAAVLYAGVVLSTKKLTSVKSETITIVQLFISAVFMFFYCLFTKEFNRPAVTPKTIILLLVAGIVHTGIAYLLYFSSVKSLKSSTVAIFSYIDPVIAIILSVTVLKENMTISGIIGAVIILGSTMLSEISIMKKQKK